MLSLCALHLSVSWLQTFVLGIFLFLVYFKVSLPSPQPLSQKQDQPPPLCPSSLSPLTPSPSCLCPLSQSLAWEYSAETIAILFVELCMGLLTLQKLHNLAVAGLVLSLYPLSLLMVYVLENVVGLN